MFKVCNNAVSDLRLKTPEKYFTPVAPVPLQGGENNFFFHLGKLTI